MTKNLYYADQETVEEYQSLIDQSKEGLDLSDFVNSREEISLTEDGVAIINVQGMLVNHAPKIHSVLGGTDYQDLISEIKQAENHDDVKGVLLVVKSGGGQVSGCIEVCQAIENLSKPSLTYYNMGCSAAYKIGCSTDYQVTSQSSIIGNIGSITSIVDQSKMLENVGVKVHAIYNEGADLKSTGHDPQVSQKQLDFLQSEINKSGKAFQDHVLAHRPELNTEVFDARWVSGDEQVELGLADAIGNSAEAYAALLEIIEINQDLI